MGSEAKKPYIKDGVLYWELQTAVDDSKMFKIRPKYQPGDLLYVQETWKVDSVADHLLNMAIDFKAVQSGHSQAEVLCTFTPDRYKKFRKYYQKNGWQSPYFMPCEAARIFLRVTNVRVERVQDITEKDAQAEGVGDLFFEEIGYSGNPKFDLPMERKTLAIEQF